MRIGRPNEHSRASFVNFFILGPGGYTTKLAEHIQAFLGKPRLLKTKLAIRVNRFHEAHLKVNLSSQVFRFRFNARSHKKGVTQRQYVIHLDAMDPTERTRAVYVTQEEQVVIMNSYEEFKKQITARGDTVAHAGKKQQIL